MIANTIQTISPIETLRLLAHRLVAEQTPYLEFSSGSQDFIKTVEQSETLKARARAIRDELAQLVAESLAECSEKDLDDPDAHLAAGLLMATWTVAFLQAHRIFRKTRDAEAAKEAFLAMVDKGTRGVKAAMADKRDYYCQSRRGNRLFELGLGPVALAFCAASSKQDHAAIERVIAEAGRDTFGTLSSAALDGDANTASHKVYKFSDRLLRQFGPVADVVREFDRVHRVSLRTGTTLRIGMVADYEPTADAVRSLWERFGPVDIAWNINPNGTPSTEALDAGRELGCEVMKWDELKEHLKKA